ncbi:MAG: type II toxin-antitoxin system prevent-host-death family antitoxin [Deltaproteobacteria bacterium]|nr:type II toxin-antitoxin system prevent-host-death family antitoxin [Deltaproteobacteria bacterium]
MAKFINTYEAKAQLSRLIKEVQHSGELIVICQNGKPVVDLVPHKTGKDPLSQDPQLKGAFFKGDPCAPVSEEDWPEEYR